eukprot:PhM_4_TR18790/c0_g1_i1/m.77408
MRPCTSFCLLCILMLFGVLSVSARLLHIPNRFTGIAVNEECHESCCCKVCSDPAHPSYPYGALSSPESRYDNPLPNDEAVLDGYVGTPSPVSSEKQCTIPLWRESVCGFKKSDGTWSTACVSALWWKSFEFFFDTEYHIAPSTCHCCRFSGIHTSCSEEVPLATSPKSYYTKPSETPALLAHGRAVLYFTGGVQVGAGDMVEIRNDTLCGYSYPPPAAPRVMTVNATSPDKLTNTGSESYAVVRLPAAAGCYRVCYFHSRLTTPGWYDVGEVFVLHKAQQPLNFHTVGAARANSPMELHFHGGSVFDIYNDAIEMRVAGTACGSGSSGVSARVGIGPSSSVQSTGSLHPGTGTRWCQPEVVPRVTTFRPLQYVTVQYTDCAVSNRLPVSSVYWSLTIPSTVTSSGNQTICYYHHYLAAWTELGNVYVHKINTPVESLRALFRATGGERGVWLRSHRWDTELQLTPTSSNVCLFSKPLFGVRCADAASSKVTHIVLPRNNLVGTLPAEFFAGDFSSVEYLNLRENQLFGTLPKMISTWTSLLHLDLGQNGLVGPIPEELGDEHPLTSLYLDENAFTGQLPRHLRSLVTLKQIFVDKNDETYFHKLEVPQSVEYLYAVPDPQVCPVAEMVCPDKGSTEEGSNACGYDGISEQECVVRGCCFNAQAPLVFGGKTCFTRVKAANLDPFPKCEKLSCVAINVGS